MISKTGHWLPAHLDVRLWVVILMAAILAVITSRGFFLPGLFFTLSWLACLFCRVKAGRFFLRLAEPLFIASVLLVLQTFLQGTKPLFTLNLGLFALTAYEEGLMIGLTLAARVIAASSLLVAASFVIPFTQILAALAWFRLPRAFLEILVFAYRYLFVLLEDARVIFNSQKNRLGYAGFRRSLQSLGILGGALLVKAFDESEKLTLALTQRGYDGHLPFLVAKPLAAKEILVTLLVVAILTFLWWI